jgi:uncharacterized membrane protein YbhN (UPF0104 family)
MPMDATHEDRQSLWLITFGPAIWGAHFALSYALASVWCAKVTTDGSLGALHEVVAALTVVALAGIGLVARAGWRRHRHGDENASAPHDEDTPEDRHRFLGLATLLLALLSAVATTYVAMSAYFFSTCR